MGGRSQSKCSVRMDEDSLIQAYNQSHKYTIHEDEKGRGILMSNNKTIACILATIFISSILLTGCNTTKGLGQDLKKAGEKIEESAKKSGAKDT